MAEHTVLKKKVGELAERNWDFAAISARINKVIEEGIPKNRLSTDEMVKNRKDILDRVQLKAEENNYYLKNCAQSTALALMEEFRLGNMEIIKALTPFPGIAGTGKICGGISGSLIAFGLYFGPDKPPNLVKMSGAIKAAQRFIASFENQIGHIYCADIIENVTIGFKLNPGESEESMITFAGEKGFEKCGLPPGIGARIAANIIIDSMK